MGLSACRILVVAPENGTVAIGDTETCPSLKICVEEVSNTSYNKTFTPIPQEGWKFSHWQSGQGFLWGGSSAQPVTITTSGFAGNQSLLDLLASDIELFLQPVFVPRIEVESADFIEAVGRPGHWGLAVLSYIPPPGSIAPFRVMLEEPVKSASVTFVNAQGEDIVTHNLNPIGTDPTAFTWWLEETPIPTEDFQVVVNLVDINDESFSYQPPLPIYDVSYLNATFLNPADSISLAENVLLTLQLENSGIEADTFDISIEVLNGEVVQAPPSGISIEAGTSTTVDMVVSTNSGIPEVDVVTIRIAAYGQTYPTMNTRVEYEMPLL